MAKVPGMTAFVAAVEKKAKPEPGTFTIRGTGRPMRISTRGGHISARPIPTASERARKRARRKMESKARKRARR